MSLFETGKEAMVHEFKEVLTKHSRVVPPSTILDVLGADDDDEVAAAAPPDFQQMPADVRQNLVKIAEWLINHKHDDFMNVSAFCLYSLPFSLSLTRIGRLDG